MCANLLVCWRDLWVLKLFLDLKVLSQRLQGMTTPSRWFASMWFLMSLKWPSFPHTLQISANWCPLALRFWLFSIIEFTSLSSSSKSTELFPGMANVLHYIHQDCGYLCWVLAFTTAKKSSDFNLLVPSKQILEKRLEAAKITLCASTCWSSSQARVTSAKSLSPLKFSKGQLCRSYWPNI